MRLQVFSDLHLEFGRIYGNQGAYPNERLQGFEPGKIIEIL